ncbi:MAG: AAA family ATPase [Chloroflexi bacterium]|nr:AAA family ATPase [Chloroflexota bacterium]
MVGTSGSGKTTVARQLAERIGVPHVEIDALYWGPSWTARPDEEVRRLLIEAVQEEGWVTEGNYTRFVQPLVWEQADTVVWLDFPLARVMGQILVRTVRRAVTKEPLWHGNRESIRTAFFSRDSILLWALQSHGRQRRRYTEALEDPRWAHLQFVRLSSPGAAQRWLASVHVNDPTSARIVPDGREAQPGRVLGG